MVMLKVPFELIWRLFYGQIIIHQKKDNFDILHIIIDKIKKLWFHFYITKRAICLFFNKKSHCKHNDVIKLRDIHHK